MAELLFKLNQVPVDEILDIRQLLDDHAINYYETDSGAFGIGVSAMWLKDKEQLDEAKALLKIYQQERETTAQQEQERQSLFGKFCQAPIRFIASIAVIAGILYISIAPFLLD